MGKEQSLLTSKKVDTLWLNKTGEVVSKDMLLSVFRPARILINATALFDKEGP